MTKDELNKVINALYEYLEITPSDVTELVCLETDDKLMKRWLDIYEELQDKDCGPKGCETFGRILLAYTVLNADRNNDCLVYVDEFTEDLKHLCVFCCRLETESQ